MSEYQFRLDFEVRDYECDLEELLDRLVRVQAGAA
jgi:hypothetical protein